VVLDLEEGDVLDLEGLVIGLGSRAFIGDVELLPGCLALDLGTSLARLDRFCSLSFSLSLRNLGRCGFFCEP
jgi:hypothetical protein